MKKSPIQSSSRFNPWGNYTALFSYLVLAMFSITLTCSTALAKPARDLSGKKRILVQYRAGVSQNKIKKTVQRHRDRVVRHIRGIKAQILEVSSDEEVAAVIKRLSKDPLVKFAEVDRLVPPETIATNDPYARYAWHLDKIQAPTAWETSLGENVVVAVLDTGVDPNHPDLIGQMIPGWNLYDDNSDTSDVYGHGTNVAGTIAATSNNGIGVTSIAWDSLIMPVRISRPDGYASISDIAAGIVWAADNGAQVANISYDVATSPTIQSAAAYMRERGGIVVVSAGNSSLYRSDAPSSDIIVVGATISTDALASFSNYGEFVDLVAPGASIVTTVNGGSYALSSGTSFSSPVVAAVAALMMTANPILGPGQIHAILNETADDLGDPGKDIYFGAGRVNAAAAVNAAWSFSGGDSLAPAVNIASPTGGTVSGILSIDVGASDDVSVSRVELYLDGTLVGTETAVPYAFSWDTSAVADGPVTLVAHAYDAAGNQGVSASVDLEVKNTDTVAPAVTIISPTGGTVAGSVAIDVSASDNVGVEKVVLYLKGSLIGTVQAAPYSFKWDSTTDTNGSVALVAYAFDAAGNQAASAQVILNVQNQQVVQNPGDLDNDGDVDYTDFRTFMSSYNRSTGDPSFLAAADYDGDGMITYADYRIWYGYYRAYVYGS